MLRVQRWQFLQQLEGVQGGHWRVTMTLIIYRCYAACAGAIVAAAAVENASMSFL